MARLGADPRRLAAGEYCLYWCPCAEPVVVPPREAPRRWAELLRRIFEVDPLECPRCGHEMRVVALVSWPPMIDRILQHLRRRQCADRRHGPLRGPTARANPPRRGANRPALSRRAVRDGPGDPMSPAGRLRFHGPYSGWWKANSYPDSTMGGKVLTAGI